MSTRRTSVSEVQGRTITKPALTTNTSDCVVAWQRRTATRARDSHTVLLLNKMKGRAIPKPALTTNTSDCLMACKRPTGSWFCGQPGDNRSMHHKHQETPLLCTRTDNAPCCKHLWLHLRSTLLGNPVRLAPCEKKLEVPWKSQWAPKASQFRSC